MNTVISTLPGRLTALKFLRIAYRTLIVAAIWGNAESSGALVLPNVTVNNATVTKAALFSDANYHPTGSSDVSVDADGFEHRSEIATAWFKETKTVEMDVGGGTRTMDNSYAFESEQRQRVTQLADSFHFEATTSINTVLDSLVSVSRHGNFFFVTNVEFPSTLNVQRTIRFAVDQPMQLQIRLSGQSTNSGADFRNMFNNLALSGGNFGLADRVFVFTSTSYNASELTTFSGGGSKKGVNYELQGEANDNGIDLMIDLSPSVEGTVPVLEFRWTLPHTLNGGIGASTFGWDQVVSSSMTLNESVRIVAIPEISTVGYAALALTWGLVIRRQRTAAHGPER